MTNITVTHAPSGLMHATVVRSTRVTPHMMRVTLGGADLRRFEPQGFDQWFRLALPVGDGTRFDRLPQRFTLPAYLRYKTIPKATRPEIRNYTVRAFRPDPAELDIDFVIHGSEGVAGPWAVTAQPGEEVALIDQGCGWRPVPADWNLLVTDESGLPAVAGVLRDMPRDARGIALIELFDAADRQPTEEPEGVTVHWLERRPDEPPGSACLPALRELEFPAGTPYAFAVGESRVATGTRRHLVGERDIPKDRVTFCGYWKRRG